MSKILGCIAEASTIRTKAEQKAETEEKDLSGIFDELFIQAQAHATETGSSRWLRIYRFELILEASKLLERIHKRLEVDSQPIGTGKSKKKADPRITALERTVKSLREGLKAKWAEGGSWALEKLLQGDEGVQAAGIKVAFIEVSSDVVAFVWIMLMIGT